MTELFISKDGIIYQEAKGEIKINFVPLPDEIVKASAVKFKIVENITIKTNDIETIELLNNTSKVFIKYIEELTSTFRKGKSTRPLYDSGLVSYQKSSNNDYYKFSYCIVVKESSFSCLLNAVIKADIKKALEMVRQEYVGSQHQKKGYLESIIDS
jgi:hypothetical protein